MAKPAGTTASRPAKAAAARMIPGQTQPQFMNPSSKPLGVRKPQPLKVRATQMGYYDHVRRRQGDVFIVEASQFSRKWMETVDRETPEKVTTAKQALKEQHDEILGGRQTSRDDSVI